MMDAFAEGIGRAFHLDERTARGRLKRVTGFLPAGGRRWVLIAGVLFSSSVAMGQDSASKRERGSSSGRTVSDSLRFANGLLRQKKFDLAAQEYDRVLKADPRDAERNDARFGLGTAWLGLGRYRDVRARLTNSEGSTHDPRVTRPVSLRRNVVSARRSTNSSSGVEAFTSAKTNHQSLELAWTYLGDTCFGLEDLPKAKAAYDRSLAAFPQGRTADRARYGLARTLATSGERDRAVGLLNELAKKGSAEWVDRCWLQIGLIQESAGHLAESAEAFSELERVAPKSQLLPEAQLHHGLVLSGRWASEAEDLLKPLVANGPESIGPRVALELATIELAGQHPEIRRGNSRECDQVLSEK